ncbi:MAG: pilus assembly protein [Porphyrobacter sp.]|nr:pilus assembly protein [Porphyrobacter sp.]
MARPITKRALLRRLAGNSDGATLVEFAFVGPVLIMMIMGLFDIAHTQYTSSVLHGAMQKAGRDLTLESALSRQSQIDQRVIDQVRSVMPNGATVTLEKFSHFDFSDVNQPEEFTDQNKDGRCNNNEPYVDNNDNGRWDADRGKDGIGGARDVVLYEATVSYPRMFPMYGLAGLPTTVTIKAATILRNQPFDEQNDRITTVRNCP